MANGIQAHQGLRQYSRKRSATMLQSAFLDGRSSCITIFSRSSRGLSSFTRFMLIIVEGLQLYLWRCSLRICSNSSRIARRTRMSGRDSAYPATSVTLLREMRVEDAYDIELLWKTPTGLCGPRHNDYGHSPMRIWPLCLFLLASCATHFGPRAILHPGSPVRSIRSLLLYRRDSLMRNHCSQSIPTTEEDLVLQASARHQCLPSQAVACGRYQQTWRLPSLPQG